MVYLLEQHRSHCDRFSSPRTNFACAPSSRALKRETNATKGVMMLMALPMHVKPSPTLVHWTRAKS